MEFSARFLIRKGFPIGVLYGVADHILEPPSLACHTGIPLCRNSNMNCCRKANGFSSLLMWTYENTGVTSQFCPLLGCLTPMSRLRVPMTRAGTGPTYNDHLVETGWEGVLVGGARQGVILELRTGSKQVTLTRNPSA